MLLFVPIAKSALDVCPPVKAWTSSWAGDSEVEFLKPKGWFERGHDCLVFGVIGLHWESGP
jgi:hypothetical protein